MKPVDFLVIGSGIAGAGIAYHLAQSADVALIERESLPGYHTTGRSAALFAEAYGNATVRALTRASRAFFEMPPEAFAEHALLTPRGALFIARADQRAALDAQRRITPGNPPILDTAAARRLVPILRADYVAAALLDGDAMDIDVAALHQGFLRGAKARGATLVTSAELRALTRGRATWRVETAACSFEAPVVINAAGAWAEVVGAMAGARPIGLQPLRRTAMIVDPPADAIIGRWPFVIDADEQFYLKPETGKLLLSPADETPSPPCDAQAEELDLALAIDRVQAATELPVRRILRSWAGLRSFVADRSPVVGFDDGAPGFFWLAAQGGYGIQTAPALSLLAAALARGDAVPTDLRAAGVAADAVAPGRPALSATPGDATPA
jgi:D-arginine dehydrogenase